MITDLQNRKLTQLFKMCDIDGDAHLRQSDFDQAAANIAHAFQVSADSETYAQLHAMYTQQWQQIKQYADPNGNGRVDLNEWLAYWDGMLNSPEAMQMLIAGYDEGFLAMLDLVDPKGPSRHITTERWGKYFAAYNQPAQEGMAAIQRVDSDGDGKITSAQMRQATMEFFGDDPNAPGNGMFGTY